MHLTAAKRVLHYLKATSNLCIHYRRLPHSELSAVGYTDSEGDREACPFEGAGAAADPYRKDPLSLSLKTSLL